MKRYTYILLFCLFTGCFSLQAQTLVANIAQSNAGSDPASLQSDGRYVVFTAADAEYDRQLYILRGTDGAPTPLVDGITQLPVMNPYGVVLIDGSVYYYTHGEGSTSYYRAELESGVITELATLPSSGANGGDPQFTSLNTRIVFVHITASYGRQLYAIEKEGGSLTLLSDLPESGGPRLLRVGNRIFLSFPSDPIQYGITDGTPEGTFVRYPGEGLTYLDLPSPFGSTFILRVFTGSRFTLYRYDTLTTDLAPLEERVTDIPSGTLSNLTTVGDYVYFTRSEADYSAELWRVDPAADTAALVIDLNPNLDSVVVSQVQVFGDLIFYRLYDQNSGLSSLNRTDGTAAGTVLLLDEFASRSSNGFSLGEVVATDDDYYFLADRPSSGTELWRTDGTTAGTRLVTDLYPGSDDGEISQLTTRGSELLFVGTGPDYGGEVYRTDGTAAGTEVIADLNTVEVGSNPNRFFTFNDTLFFSARTGCTGFELFKTGGTASSTSLLGDLTPGRGDSQTSSPLRIGDRFYFGVKGDFPGSDTIFASDGTSAGTVRLESAGLPPGVLSGPGALGDRLMVRGFFYGLGQALYSLDPATGDAQLLRVFSPSGGNSFGSAFLPFQDSLLLFVEATQEFGAELWRTNGTPEGTYMVRDIRQVNEPGRISFHIYDLEVIGDLAYFSADDGFGQRPYRSDGTEAGTYQLRGGGELVGAREFTRYAGRVYFVASNAGITGIYSTAGERYDVAGSPISSVVDYTFINDLTVLGSKLLFTAATTAEGTELWAAAGANSPAVLLGDLYAGPENSYPRSLFVADSTTLLFSADVPELGRELWSTDGTPQGTVLVADINPGTASSDPENFYGYGAFTYFAANDGQTGSELWKYSPADLDNDGYVGVDDADEGDPLINAGTNGDPNVVGLICAAPGDTSTSLAILPDIAMDVYPNPTVDRLNIRIPEGRALGMDLFASDGRILYSETGLTTEYSLAVSHFPAGTYVLRVRDLVDGRTGYRQVTIGK